MKKTALLTVFLFFVFHLCIFGQIPVGYYNEIDGKQERDLKTALHKTIRNHTFLDYDTSTTLWWYSYFMATDWHPDGHFWDMYSFDRHSTYSGSRQNREHSMPRSWWRNQAIDNYGDANGDLHNLFPSNAAANAAKSNYPLGTTAGGSFNNGVSKVGQNTFPGYSGIVFEPTDEYKGDFARTYMYMVTCYEDYASRWTSIGRNSMLQNNTYPTLSPYAVSLLLEWHRNDPVSSKETDRNDAVQRLQNNRNPFIDLPDLAEYIWGNRMSSVFELPPGLLAQSPVLIAPVNLTDVPFGEVQRGSEVAQTIIVKGLHLTGNLSVMLSGDIEFFSISTGIIPASVANSSEGYNLEVSYNPTEYGEHRAQLIIFGGNLGGGSYAVYLSGVCSSSASLPPPAFADFPDLYIERDAIKFRTYAPGSEVFIYNTLGKLLYAEKGTGEWEGFKTQSGVYIIRHNGKTRKVVLQ